MEGKTLTKEFHLKGRLSSPADKWIEIPSGTQRDQDITDSLSEIDIYLKENSIQLSDNYDLGLHEGALMNPSLFRAHNLKGTLITQQIYSNKKEVNYKIIFANNSKNKSNLEESFETIENFLRLRDYKSKIKTVDREFNFFLNEPSRLVEYFK